MRKFLFVMLGLLLAVLGFALISPLLEPAPTELVRLPVFTATPFIIASTTPAPTAQELVPAKTWGLVSQRYDASSQELGLSAVFTAPIITVEGYPGLTGFNPTIQTYLSDSKSKTLEYAKNGLSTNGSFSRLNYEISSAPGWQPHTNNFFVASPNGPFTPKEVLFGAGHEILSLIFSGVSYFSGAHPGDWHDTFNFDLTTGQRLALDNLFRYQSTYLQTISDYCIADLSSHLGADNVNNTNVPPAAETFTDWAVTPQGLLIIFETYSVAAGFEGPQSVIIPYSALAGDLDPNGPLGKFVK